MKNHCLRQINVFLKVVITNFDSQVKLETVEKLMQ